MSEFRLLRPDDHEAYAAILAASDRLLEPILARSREQARSRPPYSHVGDWYGKMGHCKETSDAVTRAAHALGIVASREMLAGWHFITSLAPLDQPPTDDDLVIDRTWGQLNKPGYDERPGPFFGRRRELAGMVRDFYSDTFAADSVQYRQIIHTPIPGHPDARHAWLNTSVQEVMTGDYPIGEASFDDYPGRFWD